MKALFISLLMAVTCEARELVWSDEFNGSELDRSKWNYEEGKRHEAINTKEAIVVKDGCMTINTFTRNGQHYTGMITTEGLFDSAFGRWEIRAKFDDQPGTWSCAWLYSDSVALGLDDIDKGGMEIDIFEHRKFDMNNKDISSVVNHTLHWNGYAEKHQVRATHTLINEGFNVYALEWTDKEYKFYVNDILTWTVGIVTKKPLHFIFSTEIGYLDFWTQPTLKEYKHTTMTVDYIRYYR